MEILKADQVLNEKIRSFFENHWGSSKMVISSGVYDCSTLDGFVVLDHNDNIIGLITFIIKNEACEIISLDSIKEGEGIGTALVKEVERMARNKGCILVKLVTTNDNLYALKFYQKRDFLISTIHINAVEKARVLKPEIPYVGYEGIPIRDEIELIKLL
ncbi:GNAT superfamily N-acetyltransferase [Bacillus mesophilus]|uniref:GNAT family N-acetyltransferase n=1 Tax=Bacillus mesophilus TaxID=1808955 RepID=A0A6M0QCU8_9BACI|nr:GNAT family N-acetyltransferase [Bacillus mesophilus]MBM7663469.1 GNAT superfamily N-acetyltransferase [Bacillus mesophilus]NEY74181.1 GNAT family N-acetyltransferase [Bacillus mesophilus]